MAKEPIDDEIIIHSDDGGTFDPNAYTVYPQDEKERLRKLLDDISVNSEYFYSRIEEGTNNAFEKFSSMLDADLKTRVLKLENPPEKAFSWGGFFFDAILSIFGAGLLKTFSTYVGIKSVKAWQVHSISHHVITFDTKKGLIKTGVPSTLDKFSKKIQTHFDLDQNQFFDIVKNSSKEMTEATLKKITAFREYEKDTSKRIVTLSEKLRELIDYKSKIIIHIKDSFIDKKRALKEMKSIDDDEDFFEVVKYIYMNLKIHEETQYENVVSDWSNTVLNFILAFYFNQYKLSLGSKRIITDEGGGMLGEHKQGIITVEINPFHGISFTDDILKNFPTSENSFIKRALVKKGSSENIEEAIKNKNMDQSIRLYNYATDEYVGDKYTGKVNKFSVYNNALLEAHSWYNQLYIEYTDGIIIFNNAVESFELKYSKAKK